MTTFSSFSFRINKISPYIYFFKNLWQDFDAPLRAAPGGRCPPPPAPPRYATGDDAVSGRGGGAPIAIFCKKLNI